MLQSILHLTGFNQKLQSLKERIEDQAQGLIDHGKAVAIQMAIVTALAAGAGILVLMACVAGLITLYLWLEPQVGSIAAMGLIAGGLVVVGAGLAIAAVIAGRKETPETTISPAEQESASALADAKSAAARLDPPASVAPPARPVTLDEVESIFAAAGPFARAPQTGIEQVDKVIRALAPKAEEATKEAVTRAAHLVRYGDRTTVMAILGTAMLVGWAVTKADRVASS
jgi:hypothetical protein